MLSGKFGGLPGCGFITVISALSAAGKAIFVIRNLQAIHQIAAAFTDRRLSRLHGKT